MKVYSEYKESGIEWVGKIPKHWNAIRIKHTDELIMGQSPSSDDYNQEQIGLPFLQGNADFTNLHPVPRIWCDTAYKTSQKGDVLLSVRAPVGALNIADQDYGIGRGLCAIRAKNSISKLIFYSLSAAHEELNSIGTGSTYTAISADDVKNTYLPHSPLPEQQAIADFLDRKTAQIDTLIEKKQRQIELLQEQRTALINDAVTGKLDLTGFGKPVRSARPMKDSGVEWLGEIPIHWKVHSLKRLAELKSGDSITSEEIYETGDYAVYGGNGLRGYCSKYTHEGEFVLIGRQGALCGNINYAKGKFWASEHAVVATPKKTYKTIWFGELLRAMNLNQYSMAAAQPGLSVERISNIQIPVPPLDEQKEIENFLVEKFKKIDELIRILNNQVELNKEYRTALISEAVTGKIDVRTVHE